MDLYPRNATAELDLELFRDPTAEYRGAPFWCWNTRLDEGQLMRQIEMFKAMGMGGFHIHVRTGLATPYLGDEFMRLVRRSVERAKARDMLAWLYDEDRWPSGYGGGFVTREPRYRAKHLLWTRQPYDGSAGAPRMISAASASRTGNGTLLGRYHVTLRDGFLAGYRRLEEGVAPPADGVVWHAYLETAVPSPWFNNQTYVDTLQRDAVSRFIEITYERYRETIGEYFGTTVPAIFTDEPQFVHKQSLHFTADAGDVFLPWTTDLGETYRQVYGQDLVDVLPELFWELPDGQASLARYRYHDHLSERFSAAYADTCGAWCRDHGIALTGHMMEEPTLRSQTAALGEAMRSYRGFDLPGIDILCDWREYTTAKQAQSAAHQFGRPGVLSELYGVTNWDFDFVGHKGQGDWQAALGVTVRVHHLAWVSMAGEAKRDYPAAIGYQSPWYREYGLVENHFARLNTVLTRGKALVRVGVVHPIESFWLAFGPLEQTQIERDEREHAFADLTDWLLFGLIDFDFIAESLLPELGSAQTGAQLAVGEARYDAVIVPAMRTVRSTTLDHLEAFHTAGGALIFAGEVPSLVDGVPAERAEKLAAVAARVAWSRGHILDAVAPFREVEARLQDAKPADSFLHQIRVDGDRRSIFLCNTDRVRPCDGSRICLRGEWMVTEMDTLSGEIRPRAAPYEDGRTVVVWNAPAHGSLLLSLSPGVSGVGSSSALPVVASESGRGDEAVPVWVEHRRLADPVPVTLAEPNVLLLDQAAYRLNEEPWQPTEEILRLDTLLRRRLGFPLRMEALAQPWTNPNSDPPADTLSLRFVIESTLDLDGLQIALEDSAIVTIMLDSASVPSTVTGWFVDEAIQTVRLPAIGAGRHTLELTMPYGRLTNPEWCYLIGDFGVELRGRHARLVAPVRELSFGDWTQQGLPLYAGNVTYHCRLEADGSTELALHTPIFKAPLLSVALDGQEVGKIAFAPFRLDLRLLAPGTYRLDITAFGNRHNSFGALHNCNEQWIWFGPNAWRTVGDEWSYEYQLSPMGLLVAPQIQRKGSDHDETPTP